MIDRSEKPVLQALSGMVREPTPLWLMRQAGRYLPEYRELRSKVSGFLELCFTPALAAEVTLQPIRRFGFDAAILFSDILVIPHALGQKLWFAEGEGPRLEPLANVSALKPDNVLNALSPVFETVVRVRGELSPATTLIGFAGAPWTVATYMIAGRGSDDGDAARLFAYAKPAEFQALLDTLVEATAAYLIAQVDAGAEVLQIFESWADAIPANAVDAFSLEPIRKIIERVRAKKPSIPFIVFPRGAGTHYPRYAVTGATALSVDTHTALGSVQGPVLQGNLDPIALIQGGEALRGAVRQIRDAMRGKPFIFNLGHGIRPETPIAHVEELIKLVRSSA